MANPVRTPTLLPVALAIFALGLLAVAAIFVLYVTGRHDLPLWLNSSAGVLVPLGFALALVALLREARQRPRKAESATQRDGSPQHLG